MSDFDDDGDVGDGLVEDAEPAVVSIQVITGIRPEAAMKLSVSIFGHDLVALLDTGSTHNFITTELGHGIGLREEPCAMRVTVANGDKLQCGSVCRDIPAIIGT